MAVVSSELIPIQRAQLGESEVNAVSGRDLHAFLGVGTRFNDWISRRILEYGFAEHRDFECYSDLSNPTAKEYSISLSMAKELAMVERNEKGKQARLYFIECERRATAPVLAAMSQFRVPTTFVEALHLSAELEEARGGKNLKE